MELTKVTFTGVDERTDLKRLARLQRVFPFAEFGVLLSFDWKENGNRFPDPKILPSLEKLGLNLSAHFCGQSAFDVAGGKRFRIDELVGRYIRIFQRCQPEQIWSALILLRLPLPRGISFRTPLIMLSK